MNTENQTQETKKVVEQFVNEIKSHVKEIPPQYLTGVEKLTTTISEALHEAGILNDEGLNAVKEVFAAIKPKEVVEHIDADVKSMMDNFTEVLKAKGLEYVINIQSLDKSGAVLNTLCSTQFLGNTIYRLTTQLG